MTAPRRGWARPARSRRPGGLSPPEGAKRSACGERGRSPQKRGPKPARVGGRCPREEGAVAHEESWGAVAHEERGAVAHEESKGAVAHEDGKGAVAHEESRGAVAHEEEGAQATKSRRLTAEEGAVHTGKKGPAREDGVRAAGKMARCQGEGHPARIGECTRVVTERLRFPAPNVPPRRVLSARSNPGPKSARLRSKSEAYAGVPRSLRSSRSHGRFHANSTEGTLRS